MISTDITRSEFGNLDQRNLEESVIRINIKTSSPKATRVMRSNPAGGIQKLSKTQKKKLARAKRNSRKN
jgi:hypothetical protein